MDDFGLDDWSCDAGFPDDPATLWRMTIQIRYEGPFDRLGNWLLCIDPVTCEILREVPAGSLRDWLAARAERLDAIWRGWYVRHGRYPPDRWRRRLTPEARENPVNPWSSYGRDKSW